jgi:hypothetical protein
MNAAAIKNGEFKLSIKRCCRYGLPFHLSMVGQLCRGGFDLHQFRPFMTAGIVSQRSLPPSQGNYGSESR